MARAPKFIWDYPRSPSQPAGFQRLVNRKIRFFGLFNPCMICSFPNIIKTLANMAPLQKNHIV